jgi:hypothetical protein
MPQTISATRRPEATFSMNDIGRASTRPRAGWTDMNSGGLPISVSRTRIAFLMLGQFSEAVDQGGAGTENPARMSVAAATLDA